MSRSSALALALSTLVSGAAHAGPWGLEADHTTVGFAVRYMIVTDVKGAFDKVTGTIEIDDEDPSKSRVEVEIDVASVNTRGAKRGEHLRSADAFDAAKLPKLTFKSTEVEVAKDGSIKITGDRSRHGVTKAVTRQAAPLSAESKDPWGGTRRGTTAPATINRAGFGLTWDKALEQGGGVSDTDVLIDLQGELLPKK
ncbi:MAG: polyisoprenoid-binding protein [Deltaproteobacteria bacterium]|nr:polyisoprenoid-binding protein [Deltaproteobacteria bacterium]